MYSLFNGDEEAGYLVSVLTVEFVFHMFSASDAMHVMEKITELNVFCLVLT